MDSENQQELVLVFKRLQEQFDWGWILVPIIAVTAQYIAFWFLRYSPQRGPLWSRMAKRFLGPVWALPILLGALTVYAFFAYRISQTNPTLSWPLVLGPLMLLAFFFVGLMYYRDAVSVGAIWATFLGLLRSLVYVTLGFVFLLPAVQEYNRTEKESKVVMLLDVSDSMLSVDDLPERGQLVEKLPKRQDKIIQFLTDDQIQFLKRLHQTNPVTCYRFGQELDEDAKEYPRGSSWSKEELSDWLKIDPEQKALRKQITAAERKLEDAKRREDKDAIERLEREVKHLQRKAELEPRLASGTNIGDSLLKVFDREKGNMPQGIILISDGQNNEGKEQAYRDLANLAEKAKVPILCIGVGKYREPISIKVGDIEAPRTARPDEPFPVQVPVTAQGLKGKPFEVLLEIKQVQDKEGKPLKGETTVLKEKGRHRAGEAERVKFDIDVGKLKKIDPKADAAGELEGTWEFKARVARDPMEAFDKPFHETEHVTRVLVQKKPLRVLLFAGGPSKEYQFVRTLLYREVKEKRMIMGIYLQTGKGEEIDQDVDKEWLLDHFPKYRVLDPKMNPQEDEPYVLFKYDLIIAFDPDWSAVDPESLKMLKEWVYEGGGGLIILAGPVNTYQLALPADREIMQPVLDLYPVEPDDNRLFGLGEGFNPTTKHPLVFKNVNEKSHEFMKLDEKGKGATAGWNEFFYGDPEPPDGAELIRGFYSYYPVKSVKSVANVLAEFPVDKALAVGKENQPYIVTMTPGTGKVVFIGSHEMWRLRMCKVSWHERFWIKLARYAGQGKAGKLQAYGDANIPERMVVGDKKRIEYRLRGLDLKPLRRDIVKDASKRPKVIIHRPPTKDGKPFDTRLDPQTPGEVYLVPKPNPRNEDDGWFMADFPIMTPGEYKFELKIPTTPEVIRTTVLVERPNPELDNLRPDLNRLYRIASDIERILPRITKDDVKEKLKALKGPQDEADPNAAAREGKKLYFDLDSASLIPDLMVTEYDRKRTKGKDTPIWDMGWDVGKTFDDDSWYVFGQPFRFPYVMLIVVGLLSAEWLTRKLLKLA
jgi:hypothetical protein